MLCRLATFVVEDIREPILQEIRNARVISVMFDGATDNSISEVEVVYVRYLTAAGKPKTSFLSLQPLEHAHAQGIMEAIERAFVDNNVQGWRQKLVGFGCDGAAVNLGRNNSVATRIKDGHDYIVAVHCVAHRLELGVLQAIKNNELLNDVKDILRKVHKHYHFSPKALREVKEIAMAIDEKVMKPSRVDGTRWTPHMAKALSVLCSSYSVLLTHFEHVSQAGSGQATAEVKGRATYLVKKLRSMRILRFMFFMLDLLHCISTLSLKFQRDDLNVNSMLDALESANLHLVALTQEPGVNLRKFENAITREENEGKNIIKYKQRDPMLQLTTPTKRQ